MTHFERMLQLAEETFATKEDPDQLDVDQEIIERLTKIHPSSVSEYDDGNGPAAWVIIIPTTDGLMHQFLDHKISEKELFELTPLQAEYDALYLCSAMVLEEYRRKGIAKKLTLSAIENIRKQYLIKYLFVWSFTKEGEACAEMISQYTAIPLLKKVSAH